MIQHEGLSCAILTKSGCYTVIPSGNSFTWYLYLYLYTSATTGRHASACMLVAVDQVLVELVLSFVLLLRIATHRTLAPWGISELNDRPVNAL